MVLINLVNRLAGPSVLRPGDKSKKQKARTKGVKMMALQSLECWGGKVAGVAGERGRGFIYGERKRRWFVLERPQHTTIHYSFDIYHCIL